jgi:hypothetical protein
MSGLDDNNTNNSLDIMSGLDDNNTNNSLDIMSTMSLGAT